MVYETIELALFYLAFLSNAGFEPTSSDFESTILPTKLIGYMGKAGLPPASSRSQTERSLIVELFPLLSNAGIAPTFSDFKSDVLLLN